MVWKKMQACVSHIVRQGEETVILEHNGWKIGLMGLIEEEWLLTLATLERDEVWYEDYVK